MTDVQSSAKLLPVFLHLLGLCWKRKLKVGPEGGVWAGRFFICDNEARVLIMRFGEGCLQWLPLPPRLAQPSNIFAPLHGMLGHTRVLHIRVYPPGGRSGEGGVWLSPLAIFHFLSLIFSEISV